MKADVCAKGRELITQADFRVFARGKKYYDEERITSFVCEQRDIWHAQVRGSYGEDYEIEICLEGESSSHECTCPFEGEVCKHQVAVLLAILEGPPEGLAQKMKQEEARFQNHSSQLPDSPKESFANLVQKTVKRYTHGDYIDDEDCWALCMELQEIFLEVQRDDSISWLDLLEITFHLIGAINEMYKYTDDSAGGTETVLDECFAVISSITTSVVEENILKEQKLCYKSLVDASRKLGKPDLLQVATKLAFLDEGEQVLAEIEWLLKEPLPNWPENLIRSRTVHLELIHYHILKEVDKVQAEQLLDANIHYYEFRKIAVEEAMAKENYGLVEELCYGALDEGDLGIPRWKQSWFREELVSLYVKTEKFEQLADLAEDALRGGNAQYYETARDAYIQLGLWDDQKWRIAALAKENLPSHSSLPILLDINAWSLALDVIQESSSLVYEYGELLYPYFPVEIRDLFVEDIQDKTKFAAPSGKYDGLCNNLIVFGKVCGVDQALDLMRQLQERFPQRRNMVKSFKSLELYLSYLK